MSDRRSIDSICAAAGSDAAVWQAAAPLTAPIFQNSVFAAESLEQVDDIYEGRQDGFIYSRDANPNAAVLERVVAQLEGADDAVAFASGMGAVGVSLLALLEAGDTVVASRDLYGGTSQMLTNWLPRLDIRTEFVDASNIGEVEAALDRARKPSLVLVESLTNPLLRMCDIGAIAELASARRSRLAVDNTLATPLLLRPLALGADVALHSATKSLGGHSDVTGGAAAARADLAMEIRAANRIWGSALDPFAAWLIARGVRTLPLRIERACENAARVAQFLADSPRVAAVHYPGLPGYPQRALAESTLQRGFGFMASFELAGGGEAASRFVRALRMIRFAASLGEAQTTISHPAKTSHRSLSPEERERAGISDGLIRLSCGLESADDIIGDIEQALASV